MQICIILDSYLAIYYLSAPLVQSVTIYIYIFLMLLQEFLHNKTFLLHSKIILIGFRS